MKKILALLLAGCMAFALCACGSAPAEDAENTGDETTAAGDTIVIGVFEPLSGDNGAGGKQEALGMQYANSVQPTVEIDGKEYTVKLETADNESSTDKAVSAANTLISKSPSVVLGTYGSAVAIAGSDTFADAGIPAIGVTCTNPQVTEGNDHYFRICFLDPFQGTVLANFAKEELKATKVYCLGQLGNDYDQGLINYFKEASKDLDIEIVGDDDFPENNSDFTSYLTNAKNAGAEVIFAPCSISYAQLIVTQAASQGIDMPLLASDTWDNNTVLAAAQGKDVSVYISTFYAEGGDQEFEAGFKEFINSNSENKTNNGGNDMIAAVSVMGYDAYFTALEALKAAGSADPADVMAALPSVTHSGISGDIAFDETGDAVRDTAFIKTANVTNNVWDFVKVQQIAQ
ncbi:MAG: ABC transporter substrate-binding protein [Ruminiclostridium sp.]|nr:ABC transporter substrate-binding protein [Ruminiclostridium sp.]